MMFRSSRHSIVAAGGMNGRLKSPGHRGYDSFSGRFLTRDPAKVGRNWFSYADNDPMDAVDPEGLLHIVVTIGRDGIGTGMEYADKGDKYYDDMGFECTAVGGELIRSFPVSNRPKPPHRSFPDGTYRITGVEHKRSMGGNYFVFRGSQNDPANSRSTWLHSYDRRNRRKTWRSQTLGCCRTKPDVLDSMCNDYSENRKNGNKHRVTVSHGLPRPNLGMGGRS